MINKFTVRISQIFSLAIFSLFMSSSSQAANKKATYEFKNTSHGIYLDTVTVEKGTFKRRGRCELNSVSGCLRYQEVYEKGMYISAYTAYPTCGFGYRLTGYLSIEWKSSSDSSWIRRTKNIYGSSAGDFGTQGWFISGNFGDPWGNVTVTRFAECVWAW